ncbi:MAG: hypothetical protein AB7E70_06355 [Hyphomicrobiaceae bacterium]
MRFVLAVIAGLFGAALGWAVAAGLAIAIGSLLGASNFEGALGMTAVFGIGPLGGLVGLLLGVWLALRRRGERQGRSLVWRMPVALLAIAGLVAGGAWFAYEMRPGLGTSSSGPVRLDFELRLPPGVRLTEPPRGVRITLNTERNRMPGRILERGMRLDGDRQVLAGTVELHYRSRWRLLEVILAADQPARIFDLKLAARPAHMEGYGPWRRVDLIAVGSGQPQKAPATEAFAIRTRVVYRDRELAEEAARPSR